MVGAACRPPFYFLLPQTEKKNFWRPPEPVRISMHVTIRKYTREVFFLHAIVKCPFTRFNICLKKNQNSWSSQETGCKGGTEFENYRVK
jgi:hypothetical protein